MANCTHDYTEYAENANDRHFLNTFTLDTLLTLESINDPHSAIIHTKQTYEDSEIFFF